MSKKIAPLLKTLAPLLLQAGFKTRGSSFYRRNEYFWNVLNWQTSKDVIPGKIKFTVNVGIHDLQLSSIEGEDNRIPPDIWKCHYRTRLGGLQINGDDTGDDKWWLISESEIDESIIHEFVELIRCRALPFFENFKSADGLLTVWKAGRSPGQTNGVRKHYIDLLESKGSAS